MIRLWTVLMLAACLAGCGGKSFSRQLASLTEGAALLCKHCNCYMPADADPAAPCTVCNCGYKNAQCIRGKRSDD